jgi:tetratricopeptide (TPR) repeat protein
MQGSLFAGLPKGRTFLYLFLLIVATTISYSNHFNNSFHFDDSHTIENNIFIQDLGNIPLFFTDGTTFSSLPQNQSYRPIVSASLALDYWLGGGYDLFYFHLSSYILFLLQGILMFFLLFRIFDNAFRSSWNFYIAAAATAWYMLHPANAETINYIIARSDLQSTFFVVLAFVIYIFSEKGRRYFLYLVPVAIGALAKPPAVMFAPMLLFYVLLFEENSSLGGIFSKKGLLPLKRALLRSLPAFIFCAVMYLIVDHFTPKTWQSGGSSTFHYLITQPYVITHYFITFFFPVGLSADTDWTALTSISDIRFFIGCAFIAVMIFIAFLFSKDARLRPATFGIVWFFLALIPSSSIIPFAEVLNDHRIFFPYVGLVISVCWTIGLLLQKFAKEFAKKKTYNLIVASCCILLLAGYAYGVYERNKVWHTEESLWEDVTVKSPKNARGMMNYGLAKMAKGDYATAEIYFKKAMELWPYYSFIHVNLGVLKSATGDLPAAENYFREGVRIGSNYPDTWYFYGKFLSEQRRYAEAVTHLKKCIELSPAHVGARITLMKTYFDSSNFTELEQLAKNTLEIIPGNTEAQQYLQSARNRENSNAQIEKELAKNPSAAKYIDLSLLYYQQGNYEASIEASIKALKLDPNSAEAYNNIGSSYNMLKQYDKAIAACQKALELKPDMQIAKNNLAAALNARDAATSQEKLADQQPTPENYLNLSLTYYQQGEYEKCIEACKKALKLKPDYADAYSNICASYNMMQKWDLAIEACNKAISIDANHKLAKGNLNWAKEEKAKLK